MRKEALEDIVAQQQPFFDLCCESARCLHIEALTNPRQRIADQHVDDASAAITSGDQDGIGGLFMNLSDDAGFFSAVRLLQCIQGHVSILGRDDGEKLAFIRNVQRIQSKQFAGAANRIVHGNLLFKQLNAQAAIARQLVERGGYAASRRIAHPANPGAALRGQRFHHREHRTSVGR